MKKNVKSAAETVMALAAEQRAKAAYAGPMSTGRNWKEIKDNLGHRWMFDDQKSDLTFGVYEFEGPGIPLYRLQLLAGPQNPWGVVGMFKYRRPAQFKNPQDAFKAAAFWWNGLKHDSTDIGVDMTDSWSKMASARTAFDESFPKLVVQWLTAYLDKRFSTGPTRFKDIIVTYKERTGGGKGGIPWIFLVNLKGVSVDGTPLDKFGYAPGVSDDLKLVKESVQHVLQQAQSKGRDTFLSIKTLYPPKRFGDTYQFFFALSEVPQEGAGRMAADDKLDLKKVAKNLSEEVSKLVGKKVALKVGLDPRGLTVDSDELADDLGIRLFKSLKIQHFNHGINDKAELGPDETRYWLTLHYAWEAYGRGTNGTGIAAFWIDDDGEIKHVRSELK